MGAAPPAHVTMQPLLSSQLVTVQPSAGQVTAQLDDEPQSTVHSAALEHWTAQELASEQSTSQVDSAPQSAAQLFWPVQSRSQDSLEAHAH